MDQTKGSNKYIEQVILHYRLRAIRGGPLGAVNFAFHFISVQIFQMEIYAFPSLLYVTDVLFFYQVLYYFVEVEKR